VSKDFDQTEAAPRKFKLGPLGNLNQVTKGLAKTIRAMADGTLDTHVGARICNGLGILRACLEAQQLEEKRMAAGSSEGGRIRGIVVEYVHRQMTAQELAHQETPLLEDRGGNGHDHS
jgi:hypothetical protein